MPKKSNYKDKNVVAEKIKKRKSGVPTGNAGEYFVMGELLKREFDAQLADRNTKGYDLLVGMENDKALSKVQVKSVRVHPWYVGTPDFFRTNRDQVTIYVLVGAKESTKPVRYFIARNHDLAKHVIRPSGWENGFMTMKVLERYENRWDLLGTPPLTTQRKGRQETRSASDRSGKRSN